MHAILSHFAFLSRIHVFQHDNDPKHGSKSYRDYLNSEEDNRVLQIMTWLHHSHLSIKFSWGGIDFKVWNEMPPNEQELFKVLTDYLEINSTNIPWQAIRKNAKNLLCSEHLGVVSSMKRKYEFSLIKSLIMLILDQIIVQMYAKIEKKLFLLKIKNLLFSVLKKKILGCPQTFGH